VQPAVQGDHRKLRQPRRKFRFLQFQYDAVPGAVLPDDLTVLERFGEPTYTPDTLLSSPLQMSSLESKRGVAGSVAKLLEPLQFLVLTHNRPKDLE